MIFFWISIAYLCIPILYRIVEWLSECWFSYLERGTHLSHPPWPPPPETADMARKNSSLTWRTKDGRDIPLGELSDNHLSNAIKMVARNRIRSYTTKPKDTERGYDTLSLLMKNSSFKKLYDEARKRKFNITVPANPDSISSGDHFLDIFIPIPMSKIAPGFFPTDLDSRSE